MRETEIWVTAPRRTAVGSFGGAFRDVKAVDLSVAVMQAIVETAGIKPKEIDDVIWGVAAQRTRDETNHARVATMRAGFPESVTGVTVQRVCVSSLWAIAAATQAIRAGDAGVILAGGTESYSTAPYILDGARWGGRLGGVEMSDPVVDGLHRIGIGPPMGITAENLADRYAITRLEQDKLALSSHQRACRAAREGLFREEIVPFTIPQRRGEPRIVDRDEGPREDTTLEKLSVLPPAFKKGGTVTAGNSSSMNDASAGILVTSADEARRLSLRPMARIRSYAVAGVNPDFMGIGPVPATRKALEKAGLTLEDIDLIEVNEAFAAQYLAVEKELGLNREITNVNGSGISLGHPIGATGCRIVATLLHEMSRRSAKLGLATLCGGGGVAMAMIFERL